MSAQLWLRRMPGLSAALATQQKATSAHLNEQIFGCCERVVKHVSGSVLMCNPSQAWEQKSLRRYTSMHWVTAVRAPFAHPAASNAWDRMPALLASTHTDLQHGVCH